MPSSSTNHFVNLDAVQKVQRLQCRIIPHGFGNVSCAVAPVWSNTIDTMESYYATGVFKTSSKFSNVEALAIMSTDHG